LSDIQASYEEIIDSLSEEEKESDILNEAKDAFVPADVSRNIKELFGTFTKAKIAIQSYDEDLFEKKLVQVQELIDEEKGLKKQVKEDCAALHLLTKRTIEELSDAQIIDLLEAKWIQPLITALHKIPDDIVAGFISRIRALSDKYATTYAKVAEEIAETKSSLSALIDELTGNEYDIKGLKEFQKTCLCSGIIKDSGNE
jgi:type I restriction enzyme M protein